MRSVLLKAAPLEALWLPLGVLVAMAVGEHAAAGGDETRARLEDAAIIRELSAELDVAS